MPTALIIDDEFANIELLKAYLSLRNVNTMTSRTGQDGYKQATTQLPDVILMDLVMPDYTWNGYEATRQLKQNPQTQHIPVIAVTAAGDERLANEAGCDGFLRRPFRAADLQRVLRDYLSLN